MRKYFSMCLACGKKYSDNLTLAWHWKERHNSLGKTRCYECGKEGFITEEQNANHYRFHENIRSLELKYLFRNHTYKVLTIVESCWSIMVGVHCATILMQSKISGPLTRMKVRKPIEQDAEESTMPSRIWGPLMRIEQLMGMKIRRLPVKQDAEGAIKSSQVLQKNIWISNCNSYNLQVMEMSYFWTFLLHVWTQTTVASSNAQGFLFDVLSLLRFVVSKCIAT